MKCRYWRLAGVRTDWSTGDERVAAGSGGCGGDDGDVVIDGGGGEDGDDGRSTEWTWRPPAGDYLEWTARMDGKVNASDGRDSRCGGEGGGNSDSGGGDGSETMGRGG